MKINKVQSVYFSPCGGTQNVVKAICADLGEHVVEHDVTRPDMRAQTICFDENDLVFFAFPVYGGHLPILAPSVFEKLAGQGTPAVLVAVYGNRAWEGALVEMHRLALESGFKPIAAAACIAEHSIIHEVAQHRPDAADKSLLAEFGRKVFEYAEKNPVAIKAPGQAKAAAPKGDGKTQFVICDTELCIGCGICSEVCPTASISSAAPEMSSSETCIICGACIKACPERARSFIPPLLAKAREHLKDAYVRKEPEFFFPH